MRESKTLGKWVEFLRNKWYNKGSNSVTVTCNQRNREKKGVDDVYSAMDIAKYIISYCYKLGKPVSNLQLQKILYFLWVDFFNITQQDLFSDEIEAWQLGPVVPETYYEFNHYAGNAIKKDFATNVIDNRDLTLLNDFMGQYVGVSAFDLVEQSHISNGPWAKVYQDGKGNHKTISYDLIRELG